MEENSVMVTNNDSNVLNLEISTDTSSVNIESAALYSEAIADHNSKQNAHLNITAPINNELTSINSGLTSINASLVSKANTTDVNTSLATKANQSTTYTKTEVDTVLGTKVNTSDSTVTKQGNVFNGNNQLIKTSATGKYPSLDGSSIINIVPKGYSHWYNGSTTITVTIATAGVYVPLSSSNIVLNQSSSDFTWSNGIGTCVTAGKYRIDYSMVASCATASKTLASAVFKNGAELTTIAKCLNFMNIVNSFVTLSGSGITDFTAGDTIQLAVTNMTTALPFLVSYMNFVLQRIA